MLKPITQEAHKAIFEPLAIIVNETKAVAELPEMMRGIKCLDIWSKGHCLLTYTLMTNGRRWFSLNGQPYRMRTGKEVLAFAREWLEYHKLMEV